MTRRSLSAILANDYLSLREVWDWYGFQRSLIGDEKSRLLNAIARGEPPATSRYQFKSRDELEQEFAFQKRELDQAAMLGLLAATEAAMRVDFVERVRDKRKDVLSREFWTIYRQQGIGKIRLERDILDAWTKRRQDVGVKSAVAEFKGALKLRNWLAHGRWYKPKLGRPTGYDPVDVFDICTQMLQVMGVMSHDPRGDRTGL